MILCRALSYEENTLDKSRLSAHDGVAIRFPFAQSDLTEMLRKFDIWGNELPRRCAPRNDSGGHALVQ